MQFHAARNQAMQFCAARNQTNQWRHRNETVTLLTYVNNLGAIPKCGQACRLDSCIHHRALLFSHNS